MKSVRALGVLVLVSAVATAAGGVWWFQTSTRRAALIEERAAVEVTRADVRAADVLVSQAIVFALDGVTGSVATESVDRARAAAADAVVVLRPAEPRAQSVAEAVESFSDEALTATEELALGDLDAARARYGGELAQARSDLDRVVADRIEEIDRTVVALEDRIVAASILTWLLGGALLIGILSLVRVAATGERVEDDEPEEALAVPPSPAPASTKRPHIVIQLPTGPNTLTHRRRYPRVEDLGWLIGEVIKPYRARGWEMSLSCPAVGVDCDPADVREVLNSLLRRADASGADRIGIAVRPTRHRVEVVVADDGASIFGPDSYVTASEPIRLRSSVRTRSEADTAELTWSRRDGLNYATLDLPRLGIVLPIGADA